jgi:hypothetical protein
MGHDFRQNGIGLPAKVSGAGFRDGGNPSGRPVVLSRFVVVLLLAGLVCSPSAWGQISLVQVTTCPSPGTSCTIPATGSGHLIVVGWSSAEGTVPTIGTITDNASNVYVEAVGARAVDASVSMVDIWYAQNSNSGATSVTIAPSPSGSPGAAVIWEFSGAATVSPLDQVGVLNSQPAPTQGPTLGASVTTTAPVEAVVSVTAPQWYIGSLWGGSFIQDSLINSPGGSSPYYSAGWAHLITSSTGTYSANWGSWGNIYTSTAASFKAGASYSACDLNEDGVVNILDVQLATDDVLATLTLPPSPCIAPFGQCNLALVEAVLTDAMGGACVLPVLAMTPSSISFGNVADGSSSTQTATLTGTGTASTTISQATVSGTGFSISGLSLPLTLGVGQNASFSVTFTPGGTGSATGSITFASDALDTPFVETLSGNGVAVLGVAPSSISFGNVAVGSSSTQALTVTVTGTVTIQQATVSGAGFSISGPSLPLTLSLGQTASFNVTFAPAAGGSASGNIAFVSNAPNTPVNVPLSGIGVHNVVLSWTPSITSDVASYNIYRITSSSTTAPATPYPSLASVLATGCSATLCTYTDNSVAAGTSYWYYASAVDTSNNVSAPSNIVQAAVPTP